MAVHTPRDGWRTRIEAARLDVARQLSRDVELPPSGAARLETLLDLVIAWGRRVDLTAARDPEELVDLYLVDALVIASTEPAVDDRRWVEVGSGGGAPGLVLALLRPSLDLTLVEPRTKRSSFLRTAASQLGVERVSVERSRSEGLPDGDWQVALSRATLPPREWLEEGARLARGAVWVLLGRGEAPSLAGWRAEVDLPYRLPSSGATRRALRYVPDAQ